MNTLISKIHSLQDIEWVKKLAKYVFCLAVLIEVLIVIVDKSQLMNPMEGRLFQITFALCTLKVVLTKYDFKEYVVIFLFCVLGLLVDITGDRNEILRMVMLVVACKDIDIEKCLKYVLWITVAGCGVLALLSITGIFGELTVPKEYEGGIFVDRYCFGMGNANAFHIMFFALVTLTLYVYEKAIEWIGYVVLFLLNIGVYFLTSCKTGLALTALGIILMACNKYLKDENIVKKILGIGCIVVQPVVVGVSIYFAYVSEFLYRFSWAEWSIADEMPIDFLIKVDDLLTGRIFSLSNDTRQSGTLKTWTWLSSRENVEYFDLGIVRLFFWYGIIVAAIVVLLILALSIFCFIKKKYAEVFYIGLISLFTFVEAHFISVYLGRAYILFIVGAFWPLLLKGWKQGQGTDDQCKTLGEA